MFFGMNFLGLDSVIYPTHSFQEQNKLTLKNSKLDGINIKQNNELDQGVNFSISDFDSYTILTADYNKDTNAGNVDWLFENVKEIYVKMRVKGTFEWMTIYRHAISSVEDFNFNGITFLNASGVTYEVAFVPIVNGYEGSYTIIEVESSFDSLVLCDKDTCYSTALDVGSCDISNQSSGVILEGFYTKYPYYFKTSEADYDTGNVEACWIQYNQDNDSYDIDGRNDFMQSIKAYINNGKPKLLKHFDGRKWLVVTQKYSDQESGHWQHRISKFEWTEVGDSNSEQDLYDCGISGISPEYFSKG